MFRNNNDTDIEKKGSKIALSQEIQAQPEEAGIANAPVSPTYQLRRQFGVHTQFGRSTANPSHELAIEEIRLQNMQALFRKE